MRKVTLVLLMLSIPAAAYDLSYDLSLMQFKETSKLSNSFSFVEAISRTVSMNTNATFSADRSIDLDRFVDSRSGSAGVRWSPMEKIELAATLSRNLTIEERFGDTVQDQVDNTTAGEIRYSPFTWGRVFISLGSHFRDSETLIGDSVQESHDEGGIRNFDITVQKSVFPRLSTSLSFGENRSLGRQLDTGTDDMNARLNYSFPSEFRGGGIDVQLGASRRFSTYSDSSYSMRQQNWNHAVTFTLPKVVESVAIQLGTDWSWNKKYWDYEEAETQGDPRDILERSRGLTGQVRWAMIENLSCDLSFSRGISRSDKKRTGYGTEELFDVYELSDDKLLNATLVYTPGESRITFQRSIQLRKYDTVGTWPGYGGIVYEDNSDRDELREVLSLDVEVPVSRRLTLTGAVQGQSLETIYLMSEYSGNSKSSSSYSFTPGYEYELPDDWDITHTIKLAADYTTFRFPESSYSGSNLLIRRINSNFRFQRMASDSTTLGLGHELRIQDQGSYDGGLYNRSEESINNTVTLNAGFHIGQGIGVTPSYSFEYSRRNFLASTIPPLEENLHHMGLRTRMALGDGTLSVNLTRTIYSNDRPSYWNASMGFNYVF